jgi:hypothetical protein
MRFQSRATFAFATTVAALSTVISVTARAQAAPGDVRGTAAVTGYTQFNTKLDSGGRFNWAGGLGSASLTRQFTPQLSIGLAARYEYQSWNFNEPDAFGNVAPWKNLNAPSIGVDFTYAWAPDLFIKVIPTVAWTYESGASTGDALSYGAVASVSKAFSLDLLVGLGVSAFRRIDKTQALPFLVVNWKINDQWRVNNPFAAGPAGGAGLEIVYTPNDRWEFAQGLTYRSYRFRLATDNATPSGIGENSFIPLFMRVTRKLTKDARVDFYGAIVTGGKLTVDTENGDGLYSDNYKIAPALGATLVVNF